MKYTYKELKQYVHTHMVVDWLTLLYTHKLSSKKMCILSLYVVDIMYSYLPRGKDKYMLGFYIEEVTNYIQGKLTDKEIQPVRDRLQRYSCCDIATILRSILEYTDDAYSLSKNFYIFMQWLKTTNNLLPWYKRSLFRMRSGKRYLDALLEIIPIK